MHPELQYFDCQTNLRRITSLSNICQHIKLGQATADTQPRRKTSLAWRHNSWVKPQVLVQILANLFQGSINGEAPAKLEAQGGLLLLPFEHLHDCTAGAAILLLRISGKRRKETLGRASESADHFDPGVHLPQKQVQWTTLSSRS